MFANANLLVSVVCVSYLTRVYVYFQFELSFPSPSAGMSLPNVSTADWKGQTSVFMFSTSFLTSVSQQGTLGRRVLEAEIYFVSWGTP